MRPSMFSVAVPEPSLPTPPLFSGSLPSLALLSVLACSPLLLMRGAAAQTVQTPDAPGGSWIAPRAPEMWSRRH